MSSRAVAVSLKFRTTVVPSSFRGSGRMLHLIYATLEKSGVPTRHSIKQGKTQQLAQMVGLYGAMTKNASA